MVARKEIFALEPITDEQFQPASLDLRLRPRRLPRARQLPAGKGTVKAKLDELAMHEMDITAGGVLEKGCVYIIPLLEGLDLRHRTSAMGNPQELDRPPRHLHAPHHRPGHGLRSGQGAVQRHALRRGLAAHLQRPREARARA